jgi:hypothetical protein
MMRRSFLYRPTAEDRIVHRRWVRGVAAFYGVLALAFVLWVLASPSHKSVEQAGLASARTLSATSAIDNRYDR